MALHEPPPSEGRGLELLLCLAVLLASLEAAGWVLWKAQGGPGRLAAYSERLSEVRKRRYFPKPGLVLPVPGAETIRRTPEHQDRFRAKDALGQGFGLFDKGLDKRLVRAVVLGGESSLGLGSFDPLTGSWAPLAEKKLDWLDLVNLSGLAEGCLKQTRLYSRLAPYLAHQLVVLDFSMESGLLDSAEPFDWNTVLQRLPADQDPNAFYDGIQEALAFEPAEDFLLRSPVKSRAVWLGLALSCKLAGPAALAPSVRARRARWEKMFSEARDEAVPEKAAAVGRANRAAARFVPKAEGRAVDLRLYPFQSDPSQAGVLVAHAASIINGLHRNLKAQGKGLVVVIHPALGEVYLSPSDWKALSAGPGRARTVLLKSLDADLPVLDLTETLKKKIGETPEPLFWFDDGSYAPAGHAVVAEAVAEFLSKRVPAPGR